jgi:hypothetical protein
MKLGKTQAAMLARIQEKGYWYPGCGWIWDTRSGTLRILESLAKLGLVEKRQGEEFVPRFTGIEEVLVDGRKLVLETDGLQAYRMTGGIKGKKVLTDAPRDYALMWWKSYITGK